MNGRILKETDRQRFLTLLTRFGITPQLSDDPPVDDNDSPVGYDVHLVTNHGGVEGYSGFYCLWAFDEDGKFKGVSIWE